MNFLITQPLNCVRQNINSVHKITGLLVHFVLKVYKRFDIKNKIKCSFVEIASFKNAVYSQAKTHWRRFPQIDNVLDNSISKIKSFIDFSCLLVIQQNYFNSIIDQSYQLVIFKHSICLHLALKRFLVLIEITFRVIFLNVRKLKLCEK